MDIVTQGRASAHNRVQPKILLVEDNHANRDMLTRRLQRHNLEVCAAVDGPSGVEMAARELPDVILWMSRSARWTAGRRRG